MRRNRPLTLLLALAGLVLPRAGRAQAEAPSLDPATLPLRDARVEAFVPARWKIAAQVAGDLNADGRADRVLHVVPRDDSTRAAGDILSPGPYTHALVILLAERDGGWRRGGVAPRLLLREAWQWSMQLAIRRGVLVVGQHYGMADVWDRTHRFRLHPRNGRFVLIGRDVATFHRPEGMYDTSQKSDNLLTGERVKTTGVLQRDGSYRERVERHRIGRTTPAIEDVNEA
jgi:hypothetical protein